MSWTVTADKVLSRDEILTVITDLKRKSLRSDQTKANLILFRLSTCCGLRVSELTGLTLDNVRVASKRPSLYVPATVAKNGRARTVPLTFDQGTLDDLVSWKAHRESQGANGGSLFLCTRGGGQIDRRNARKRFKAACRVLGKERVETLTIHHGRHSFISHALHSGRNVVAVRDAAGHSSLAVTSIYAHVVTDDETVGNLFG